MTSFKFWVNCCKVRPVSWQRENLARLKKSVSPFESLEENQEKIKALEYLLN